MEKKGQAAMEFLMTYGWAILAAVIAIGVLAYFGVFSPGTYVSNMVSVNAPFGSTQELSISTSAVNFVLRNGGGDSVNITSIALSNCGTNSTDMTLTDGSTSLITIPCSPALTSGDKFKGTLTITYRTGEEMIDLTGSGSVAGRVA